MPEVEVNRRGLDVLVSNKNIQDIQVLWPRIFVGSEEEVPAMNELIGQMIHRVQRRGKYLIFVLDKGYLVSHLRMEGKYFYFDEGDVPEVIHPHTHVLIYFKDGGQLHYNDVRKFGRMEYIKADELEDYFTHRKIGPEPLESDFDLEEFTRHIKMTRRMIKPALLSQEYVAGLGNIYVDEVLYLAKIHPMSTPQSISIEQIEVLYHSIIEVLQAAVEAGGSTIRSYRNTVGKDGTYQQQLRVYGRQGQPCQRCGETIIKLKVAQRGTHICPNCQRLKEERNV